jgi:hypothetical protein
MRRSRRTSVPFLFAALPAVRAPVALPGEPGPDIGAVDARPDAVRLPSAGNGR